jgi:hypothetical protein
VRAVCAERRDDEESAVFLLFIFADTRADVNALPAHVLPNLREQQRSLAAAQGSPVAITCFI